MDGVVVILGLVLLSALAVAKFASRPTQTTDETVRPVREKASALEQLALVTTRRTKAIHRYLFRDQPDHLQVLGRIRSRTVFRDEFGDVVQTRWHAELDRFLVDKLGYTRDAIDESRLRQVVEELLDEIPPAAIDQNLAFIDLQTRAREFESTCASALQHSGYTVELKGGPGDQGADIVAAKDGVRTAFQCKLYSAPVGNDAVQQVISARHFYDCHSATVISNQGFTTSARQLAEKCGVSLVTIDDWKSTKSDSTHLIV